MTATVATAIVGNDVGRINFDEDRTRAIATKIVLIETGFISNSVTFTFKLSTYGFSKILGIYGVAHSTANSVMFTEAPTTSVTGDTVTVTVGNKAGDTKGRYYLVMGEV